MAPSRVKARTSRQINTMYGKVAVKYMTYNISIMIKVFNKPGRNLWFVCRELYPGKFPKEANAITRWILGSNKKYFPKKKKKKTRLGYETFLRTWRIKTYGIIVVRKLSRYLSAGPDAADENEEDDSPGEHEVTEQFPADSSHVLDTVRDLQHVVPETLQIH